MHWRAKDSSPQKEQGFLGAEKILEADGKLKKVSRKRVGFSGMKAPARQHTEIFDAEGTRKIGEITSGGFGPTFGRLSQWDTSRLTLGQGGHARHVVCTEQNAAC